MSYKHIASALRRFKDQQAVVSGIDEDEEGGGSHLMAGRLYLIEGYHRTVHAATVIQVWGCIQVWGVIQVWEGSYM